MDKIQSGTAFENEVKLAEKDTIELIVAGLGRTGTTSLETALEILGYKVYSSFNSMKARATSERWLQAYEQDDPRPFFRELLASYQVVSDFPQCVFADYLIEQYPQAKVILTVRDEKAWLRSISRTYQLAAGLEFKLANYLFNRIRRTHACYDKHLWPYIYEGGEWGEEAAALRNYRQHNERIKSMVPSEKLLIYDVKQGWEPLCSFLETEEIPQQDFPFINKGFNRIRREFLKLGFR